MCVAGQTNVGDRYCGEESRLFGQIDAAQAGSSNRTSDREIHPLRDDNPRSGQPFSLTLTNDGSAAPVFLRAVTR
jgi:hypothetical protein